MASPSRSGAINIAPESKIFSSRPGFSPRRWRDGAAVSFHKDDDSGSTVLLYDASRQTGTSLTIEDLASPQGVHGGINPITPISDKNWRLLTREEYLSTSYETPNVVRVYDPRSPRYSDCGPGLTMDDLSTSFVDEQKSPDCESRGEWVDGANVSFSTSFAQRITALIGSLSPVSSS